MAGPNGGEKEMKQGEIKTKRRTEAGSMFHAIQLFRMAQQV